MCRILLVQDPGPFAVSPLLRQFSAIARNSTEYQGDGWGCCWLEEGSWRRLRDPRPIWEHDLEPFGRTTLLLAHARSAFRNEDLGVENNMPFLIGQTAFAFNGELRGVRLAAEGGIGAEKLFHFLQRNLAAGLTAEALRKSVSIVKKRTRYIRAMNFIVARPNAFAVHACFSEAPGYFTLHKKADGTQTTICSEPFPGETGWTPLPNDFLEVQSF
jgi:predicted glutamine amidotransferase